MEHTVVFDTYAYVKKLKSVGFTEEQAAVQAGTIKNLIDEQLATKKDIKELELRLKHDLTVRSSIMISASVVAIAAIVKLL